MIKTPSTSPWILPIALLGVAAMAAPAVAQKKAPEARGKFDIQFKQATNSCRNTGINLDKSTLEITRTRGKKIMVTMPMVPNMKGRSGRAGKFSAKAKKGKTAIAGLQGRFKIAGHVENGSIDVVFIAEYFKGSTPLCTQSWQGVGKRK